MYKVTIHHDAGVTRELRLGAGFYSVGREYGCDIRVSAEAVSRVHARIHLNDDGLILNDLQSTHGTQVEGVRIEGTTELRLPCRFAVGPVVIEVVRSAEAELTPTTETAASNQATADGNDHFVVGEEIAKGGMGAILRATDRNLERSVAIKVILDADQATDIDRHRFVREALVLARLEHPNIVPIHELGGDAQGRLFYAMKLVKGRTLQSILEEIEAADPETLAHYTLDRLLTVFRKVCDAISFAHHRGVVHRDLKPENVMVGEFGEVLVMDWGLAKIVDEEEYTSFEETGTREGFQELNDSQLAGHAENLTMEGAVMGSPLYMPPEQADGRVSDIGPVSDIYSLGGILYTILTLRTPVGGRKLREVLDNVKTGNITPPVEVRRSKSKGRKLSRSKISDPDEVDRLPHCPRGKVPSVLSSVTMRAMARKAGDRYPRAEALAADIEKYQSGYSTSVEQLSFVGHLLLLIKRNKALSFCLITAPPLLCYLGFNLLISRYEVKRIGEIEDQVYYSRMRLMPDLWQRNQVAEMRKRLAETADSPRVGWEWYYWDRQRQPYRYRFGESRGAVHGIAISPDGKLMATAHHDRTVTILKSGEGTVLRSLKGHEGIVYSVAFTPDSKSVVSGAVG